MSIGSPDWQKSVAPIRSTSGINQARFEWHEVTNVIKNGYSQANIYTVPATKKLYITAIWISNWGTPVNWWQLLRNDVVQFWQEYDLADLLPLSGDAAIEFIAGEVVGRAFSNQDYNSDRDISFSMVGYLVDV